VADGVDAAEDGAQPARLDGPADDPRRLADGKQLLAGHDPVLAIGDGADHPIASCGALSTHVVLKAPSGTDSPPAGGRGALEGARG
jgi:hypothetical protein